MSDSFLMAMVKPLSHLPEIIARKLVVQPPSLCDNIEKLSSSSKVNHQEIYHPFDLSISFNIILLVKIIEIDHIRVRFYCLKGIDLCHDCLESTFADVLLQDLDCVLFSSRHVDSQLSLRE